jgi:hypothetical protein
VENQAPPGRRLLGSRTLWPADCSRVSEARGARSQDAERRGSAEHRESLEAAAVELLKWPKGPKRDRAARLVADAHSGKASPEAAKKAFEAAAKEAKVWVRYRGA